MLHPIYAALLQRPDLLIEHLLGYAQLLQAQASGLGGALHRRVIAGFVAALSAVLSLVFAGLALMLALLLDRYHPVLWLLPGACLGLALLGALSARRPLPEQGWSLLQEQLEADLRALRSQAHES